MDGAVARGFFLNSLAEMTAEAEAPPPWRGSKYSTTQMSI
jgi:hypothetical protein